MYSKFKKFTSFCLCSLSGLLLGAFLISLTYLIAMKYHTYLKLAPRLVIWNLAAIAVLYFLTHCLLRALNFTGLNLSVKFAEMKPIKIFLIRSFIFFDRFAGYRIISHGKFVFPAIFPKHNSQHRTVHFSGNPFRCIYSAEEILCF